MNISRFLIVFLIAIALLAPTASAEKPASKGPVKILSVIQSFDIDSIGLDIKGENFTDGDFKPIVTFDGYPITVIDGWNAELIAAEMPLKAPGDYLLEVMNHKGKTDDFYLTIREEPQDGSEDETSFLTLVISLVEVDTELGILTFHGHNFDPVAGVDTEVKLDDLLLNVSTVLDVMTHTYKKIEAILPEDFDPTGNYLLTVQTDEGMENFDAYGLYLSLNEEDSRKPLNQLLIDNAFVQYDEDDQMSYLTVSGHNFDNESWPPIVEFGGKSFTVIVDPDDENVSDPSRIVAYYKEGEELEVDPDTTLDPVLVKPQTGASTENYDAWISFSDESLSPPNHSFKEYWKECFGGDWIDTERRKGPYPVCFQLTRDYHYDLKGTFPYWKTWPYENLPFVPDPRTLRDALIYALNIPEIMWMHDWAQNLPYFDLDSEDEKKYFVVEPGGVLKLKKGYRWDGPTPPGKKKKPKNYKEILMRASLVHDTVYDLMRMEKLTPRDTKLISLRSDGFDNQRVADNSFYSICLEDGAMRVQCGGWWWGIRVGGAYSTYHKVADWKSHALADAGPDQINECGSAVGVKIGLDGRKSRYADAKEYNWTWEERGKAREAKGDLITETFLQDLANDGTVKDVMETVVTLTVDLDPKDPVNVAHKLWSEKSKDKDDVTITVLPDSEPPVITGISEPIAMWPPKHQYLNYTVEDFVYSVSDNCADLSLDDLVISQVTSDEPENAKADGHTRNDIVIALDGRSVDLRAERQGGGNGRVYTITVVAEDDNGNVARGLFQVVVPVSIKDNVVDDGPIYHVSF